MRLKMKSLGCCMASDKVGVVVPSATPGPSDHLNVTLIELPENSVLHRVHQDKYHAVQFNDSDKGNARFSPIKNEKGNITPTLYGGSSRTCAMMETIFHDIPHTPGTKNYDEAKLNSLLHSTVKLNTPLILVSLESISLHKLGVERKQLIDTEKDQYPQTRKWAEAFHQQCPDVQGMQWVSRQDDAAKAYVLFGDRIGGDVLESIGDSKSLIGNPDTNDAVYDLAEQIGVNIVPGQS